MTISSYQIQSILQTYNRQLKAHWSEKRGSGSVPTAFPRDSVDISDEGKKKHIMDRAGEVAIKNLKQLTLEKEK
jgi:hypothetical protein